MSEKPSLFTNPGLSVGGTLVPQIVREFGRRRRILSPETPRTSLRRTARRAAGAVGPFKQAARQAGYAKVKGRWTKV